MSLRTWGWGRIVLAWACYWLLLAAIVAARIWIDLRRLKRENPNADFLYGYAAGGWASVLTLVGPPLALTVAWWWVRRWR